MASKKIWELEEIVFAESSWNSLCVLRWLFSLLHLIFAKAWGARPRGVAYLHPQRCEVSEFLLIIARLPWPAPQCLPLPKEVAPVTGGFPTGRGLLCTRTHTGSLSTRRNSSPDFELGLEVLTLSAAFHQLRRPAESVWRRPAGGRARHPGDAAAPQLTWLSGLEAPLSSLRRAHLNPQHTLWGFFLSLP